MPADVSYSDARKGNVTPHANGLAWGLSLSHIPPRSAGQM